MRFEVRGIWVWIGGLREIVLCFVFWFLRIALCDLDSSLFTFSHLCGMKHGLVAFRIWSALLSASLDVLFYHRDTSK
jgi:hypothetical protein